MKTTLLLSCSVLLFAHAPADAQILAGEVPDGMSVLDIDQTITLTQPGSSDSIALEIDCDDFQDAWAVLYRGAPEVDAPNFAQLNFQDEDIEVCAELTAPFQVRPKYHAFGEPLDCAGGYEWQLNDPLVLGDFGGFFATGPFSIDSQYVAYRRGGVTGWILLSFDVQASPAVSLSIHQILPICPGPLSVDENSIAPGIRLHPNPGSGEPIRVESDAVLRSIEVIDATGRIVARHEGMLRYIPAPTVAGAYLLRATFADGQRSTQRWVRY